MSGKGVEAFRALVLADPGLQLRLALIDDPAAFAAAAMEIGASTRIDLEEADLGPILQPDPLGLHRLSPVPPSARWAPPGWLPVGVVAGPEGPAVDWAHFGGAPLVEPFFAGSVTKAIMRPFNRLFRWQTTLPHFPAGAEPAPPPKGLIFHWSRCGSTLVARMLAATGQLRVLSEPAPLDAALRLGDANLLAAMVAALSRGGEATILKLQFWHAMRLDQFREAFPDTPWVFLHRDPLEILVSQGASPGPEMMPELLPPEAFGLSRPTEPGPEYRACLLERVAEAALAGEGAARFVDHGALPQAVGEVIAPHFGLSLSGEARERMAEAARRDAKRPGQPFAADGARKRAAASAAEREAVKRHLSAVRARLQARS